MSPQQLKILMQKLESWPAERQAQIVRIADELEAQAASTTVLSDAQVAEVKRRLDDPSPRFMTLSQARAALLAKG